MTSKITPYNMMHAKIVEPVKRNKDGCRWIIYRFPIKNGISLRDAMIMDMLAQRNPLLDLCKDMLS